MMDKKKDLSMIYVNYGFWTMLLIFVLMMVFTFLKLQWPSMIAGILFVISIFFVFVVSIKAIFPEKTMAFVALGIVIVFILYFLLLSATASMAPSVLG
ncbi:MAG: hypothetical protein ACP5NW_01070 [Candidatus Woesearchaeota archaeon]